MKELTLFVSDHLWEMIFAVVFAPLAALMLGWLASWTKLLSRKRWQGRFVERGVRYTEDVTMYRLGHVAWGHSTLTAHMAESEKEDGRYRFRGKYKHSVLVAYFEGSDNSEVGVFMLRYALDDSWIGKYIVLDAREMREAVDYCWEEH